MSGEETHTDGQPLLETRGLRKRFGHVEALRGVDFSVLRQEVVALIGDNGAGKSTLVKILAGAEHPDAGVIRLDGSAVQIGSPVTARRLGIETVYQDLALAPDLEAAANLFLGRELVKPSFLGRLGVLDNRRMREESREVFESLGVTLPEKNSPVSHMSGGQQQGIAVSRSVTWASKIVLLDEPTAALGVRQTARVFELIRRVRDSGRSVVLISHNMPEVLEVADRIEVLRLGQRVGRFVAADTTVEELVTAMTSGSAEESANGAG